MGVTQIEFSSSDFPAGINLHVSDGVDFVLSLRLAIDGIVDASAWTASFTVKKGIEYQDAEFSCTEADYITLTEALNTTAENNFYDATVINEVVSDTSAGDPNVLLVIPLAVTTAFSFTKGVYALDINDGTRTHRVCTGEVVMNKFTSVNHYAP